MALDLAEANRKLDTWLAADEAVATTGQAYVHEGGGTRRQMTRADAAEITKKITYWQGWVNKLSNTSRVRHAVPL